MSSKASQTCWSSFGFENDYWCYSQGSKTRDGEAELVSIGLSWGWATLPLGHDREWNSELEQASWWSLRFPSLGDEDKQPCWLACWSRLHLTNCLEKFTARGKVFCLGLFSLEAFDYIDWLNTMTCSFSWLFYSLLAAVNKHLRHLTKSFPGLIGTTVLFLKLKLHFSFSGGFHWMNMQFLSKKAVLKWLSHSPETALQWCFTCMAPWAFLECCHFFLLSNVSSP